MQSKGHETTSLLLELSGGAPLSQSHRACDGKDTKHHLELADGQDSDARSGAAS